MIANHHHVLMTVTVSFIQRTKNWDHFPATQFFIAFYKCVFLKKLFSFNQYFIEITILLSIVFFLGMVAEMTPPTSEAVPLIGVFHLFAEAYIFTYLVQLLSEI